MRKHSARKWLHFVLDLLPVFILPIFAIYEINHNDNQPISVVAAKNQVVDFNQLINTNNGTPNTFDSTLTCEVQDDGGIYVNGYLSTSYRGLYYFQEDIDFVVGHQYYVRSLPYPGDLNCCYLQVRYLNGSSYINRINQIFTLTGPVNTVGFQYGIANTVIDDTYYLNLFDLTQMFGAGNEPTLSDFDNMFPNSYYDYTLSDKMLIKNAYTVTYDNTDVGSQMMYSLYKPVKEYFNFDNVFTFGAIYDWFELNMFGGNAPMPIYIVWNIIVYQFLMDLIFLLYSVFMFVVDFATDTIERFTGWSRKG